MIAAFDVCVTHGQVAVYRKGEPTALAWTDDHVAQGIIWSPTDVAFGVPDHDGICRLEVSHEPQETFDPEALWAVRVPFESPVDGLEIGTIADTHTVAVPPGRYTLVFEVHPGAPLGQDYAFRFKLAFCASVAPDFAILVRGDGLSTNVVLSKDAEVI